MNKIEEPESQPQGNPDPLQILADRFPALKIDNLTSEETEFRFDVAIPRLRGSTKLGVAKIMEEVNEGDIEFYDMDGNIDPVLERLSISSNHAVQTELESLRDHWRKISPKIDTEEVDPAELHRFQINLINLKHIVATKNSILNCLLEKYHKLIKEDSHYGRFLTLTEAACEHSKTQAVGRCKRAMQEASQALKDQQIETAIASILAADWHAERSGYRGQFANELEDLAHSIRERPRPTPQLSPELEHLAIQLHKTCSEELDPSKETWLQSATTAFLDAVRQASDQGLISKGTFMPSACSVWTIDDSENDPNEPQVLRCDTENYPTHESTDKNRPELPIRKGLVGRASWLEQPLAIESCLAMHPYHSSYSLAHSCGFSSAYVVPIFSQDQTLRGCLLCYSNQKITGLDDHGTHLTLAFTQILEKLWN